MPLRDFCTLQGWVVNREYVDQVSANDIAHRLAWRSLLDDAAKKKFSVVLVFKLDRAFRSVKHMHDSLAAWEAVEVSFKSGSVYFTPPSLRLSREYQVTRPMRMSSTSLTMPTRAGSGTKPPPICGWQARRQ